MGKQTTKAATDEQKRPATARKRTAGSKTTKKPANKSRKGIGGRKRAWDVLNMPTKLEAVRGWAMQGATMDELADMIGVSTSTLYEWQNDYVEFAEAIRAGRYIATGELVASAFRQSIGHAVKETKGVKVKRWEWVIDPETKRRELKQQEYLETYEATAYIPANPHITQFMLKNWLPDQFTDKQEIEHSDKQAPTFVDDLSGGGGDA